MNQDLCYKIALLKKTPIFYDLSPYALLMLASNTEVRELKFGEKLLSKDELPGACYILAYGRMKALYDFAISKTSHINDYAKKVLRAERQPVSMKFSNHEFLKVPHHLRLNRDDPPENKNYTAFQAKGKFSFQNTVLVNDDDREKVTYTQNLNYKDFEVGHVVGMRCLVDKVRTKKYINE